jgi:hypothetical protein
LFWKFKVVFGVFVFFEVELDGTVGVGVALAVVLGGGFGRVVDFEFFGVVQR